ncbi:MAG: S41 family peptidase [Flavitalea sp.]
MSRITWALIFSFLTLTSSGQSSFHRFDTLFQDFSRFEVSHLNVKSLDNLCVLAKVWGLMKYYHPKVRSGAYNWDYELFAILLKVVDVFAGERDSILLHWIHTFSYTSFNSDTPLNHTTKQTDAPYLQWIDNSGINMDLRCALKMIINKKMGRNSYYIEIGEIPKPEFVNEEKYERNPYPDAGYRLLAIYRYWNVINYYYPYRDLLGEEWDKILRTNINAFLGAKNEFQYKVQVLKLITSINDSHASLQKGGEILENALGDYYAPAEVKIFQGKAVVVNYYNKILGLNSGLMRGDIIESIDGIQVSEIISKKMDITPASNYAVKLREISRNLLRTDSEGISLSIIRNSIKSHLSVRCFKLPDEDINYKYHLQDSCCTITRENVGYINPFLLKATYIPKIMHLLRGTKGIILDFRFPPGENILAIGNYLIRKEQPFAKMTCPTNEHPGLFTYFVTSKIGGGIITSSSDIYRSPLVLLNDDETQSAAEFNTMAFRMYNKSIIIGSITAGADGDVSELNIPGGIVTTFSGLGVYYNNGKGTQRVGIIPDKIFKRTIQGIKDGKDELLQVAISTITKK